MDKVKGHEMVGRLPRQAVRASTRKPPKVPRGDEETLAMKDYPSRPVLSLSSFARRWLRRCCVIGPRAKMTKKKTSERKRMVIAAATAYLLVAVALSPLPAYLLVAVSES